MMNELLTAMSVDMGITQYHGESDESYIYRLCYSALGQWCLRIAQNTAIDSIGTTKHNQTIVLNDLMLRYSELFPFVADKFVNTDNPQINFPVHIRRVYEETGFLLTDDNNRNRLANFGRSMPIGCTSLFFGIPNTTYITNGLGVFAPPTVYTVSAREFLIRDGLTYEDYFQSKFEVIDFYNKDISLDELEFFNPLSKYAPSQSWSRHMETNYTLARKSESGPFYRVMRASETSLEFVDEPEELQNDTFSSYEYRRLYFALKAHYNNPLIASVIQQDAEYSKINIKGHLPNREYYYLLLLSWPAENAFDRVSFLLKNEFMPDVTSVLTSIGIEVKGGAQ